MKRESMHLTPTERRLLNFLVRNAGRIVTQAMASVNRKMDIGNLPQYIVRLRKKIEVAPVLPRVIITHRRWDTLSLGRRGRGGFQNRNYHDLCRLATVTVAVLVIARR